MPRRPPPLPRRTPLPPTSATSAPRRRSHHRPYPALLPPAIAAALYRLRRRRRPSPPPLPAGGPAATGRRRRRCRPAAPPLPPGGAAATGPRRNCHRASAPLPPCTAAAASTTTAVVSGRRCSLLPPPLLDPSDGTPACRPRRRCCLAAALFRPFHNSHRSPPPLPLAAIAADWRRLRWRSRLPLTGVASSGAWGRFHFCLELPRPLSAATCRCFSVPPPSPPCAATTAARRGRCCRTAPAQGAATATVRRRVHYSLAAVPLTPGASAAATRPSGGCCQAPSLWICGLLLAALRPSPSMLYGQQPASWSSRHCTSQRRTSCMRPLLDLLLTRT